MGWYFKSWLFFMDYGRKIERVLARKNSLAKANSSAL